MKNLNFIIRRRACIGKMLCAGWFGCRTLRAGSRPGRSNLPICATETDLRAEESGLNIDPHSVPPVRRAQLRRQFISYHPVLAALDTGHDGESPGWEMDHAGAALKRLDRNLDGYLSADELVPLEMAVRAELR